MEDNVTHLPMPKPKTPVKDFLVKPMQEMTMGDNLLLHTSSTVISLLVGMLFQGAITLGKRLE